MSFSDGLMNAARISETGLFRFRSALTAEYKITEEGREVKVHGARSEPDNLFFQVLNCASPA